MVEIAHEGHEINLFSKLELNSSDDHIDYGKDTCNLGSLLKRVSSTDDTDSTEFDQNCISKLRKISISEKYQEKQLETNHCLLEYQVNVKKDEDAFYIVDLSAIVKQYDKWMEQLPTFTPYYAVKCNNDLSVLKTLVALGTSFDCASMEEIKTMLGLGVSPSKIIYANPCKQPSHIKFAYENGINLMAFDNTEELFKVKENHPNARLVIRIHVDDSKSICQLGIKFGVRKGNTYDLLKMAFSLNLNVVGVSFHVGSGCMDPNAYLDAIIRAKSVFEEGKEIGYEFTLLDIGGGFPGLSGIQNGVSVEFEEMSHVINQAMLNYFPDSSKIQLIAEPGRFFVSSAFILAANIISRRTILNENKEKSYMYYVNDGVYGSFNCLIFDHAVLPYPEFMIKNPISGEVSHFSHEAFALKNEPLFDGSIWGPTCDSMDCLTQSIQLPELSVGDWMIFENMGAYTLVAASKFNGMKKAAVYYLNSEIDISLPKPSYEILKLDKKQTGLIGENLYS